ncbi:MAG: hypothetical protein KME17_23755 [Cyanosarcina radialis HA8281-LM2]|jgi:hypothetical protein|nr:hypothetical protein [Cyanosarcina radialis HA8281-LM2]
MSSTIKFMGYRCQLKWSQYPDGQPCLQLWSATDGPILTASVNLPEYLLSPDQILVKNYAENQGILEVLEAARIVKRLDRVKSGQEQADLCQILS